MQSCEFEYRTEAESEYGHHSIACSHLPGSGTSPVAVEATLKGLPASTTYYYRLTATNTNGIPGRSVNEEHFETLPAVDALSTGPAKEETPNTAKLTGSLSPDGTDAHYYFQYGTSTNYGLVSPGHPGTDVGKGGAECEPPGGPKCSPVAAETSLAGLTASTTYHFRLVGVNEFGTTYGADVTFTTPVAVEAVSTGPAVEVTGNTAKLTGSLSPDGTDAHYYFQYGTEAGIYPSTFPVPPGVDAGTGGAECVPPGGAKCSPVAASTTLTGLEGGTVYHYRIVAVNEFGSTYGHDETLTTALTPLIAGAEALHLTLSSAGELSAELRATVNPQGLGIHSCTFEYGTSTSYTTAVRCEQTKKQLGHGTEPVPVSLQVSGLAANTEYHWRLLMTNANGSSIFSTGSADHTFNYSTGAPELPDHRAYEMVTPVQKNGGVVGDTFTGQYPSISGAGSRVIAQDIQCFAASESCTAFRAINGEPFEFNRTPAGWETTALAPPATQFSENTPWRFNASEGAALFSMPTGPAGEEDWYLRSPEAAKASFVPIGPATSPGSTDVFAFNLGSPTATADLSHLVWGDKYQYGPFWPFDETEQSKGATSLYEYVGTCGGRPECDTATPFLVGVTGATGSDELISTCSTKHGVHESNTSSWDDLSADGRTVYFTADACSKGSGVANRETPVPANELYARVDGEEPGAHTVAISQPDAPQTLATTPPDDSCTTEECEKDIESPPSPAVNPSWSDAEFASASADGSKVFFRDTQQLTNGATQGAGSALDSRGCAAGSDCNLYLYDFARPAGHNLIDVSESHTPVKEEPMVQGVVATSEDGSHVYFVANGKLASGAVPGDCRKVNEALVEGKCNLYVYERDASYPEGHLAFIASLPGADYREDWDSEFYAANVTPDGRFLVFASNGDLTGDTHAHGAQIFRYDAATEQLVRISIGQDGFGDNGNAGAGAATIVPASLGESDLGPARGDPTMSNDGSFVFFQSPVALTPHALNDVVIGRVANVYEWHEGHVYLISDGRDASNAATPCIKASEGFASAVCLLGSDATGSNVFFTTTDQLVAKDTDTQVDIYDARICEPANGNSCISEPPPPLPRCKEEACHGIPAPTPSGLTPGTASFNGEGNVTPPTPPPAGKPKTAAQVRAEKLTKARGRQINCVGWFLG